MDFNQQEFEEFAILNKSKNDKKGEQIWNSYLGYITIRPLGGSPFGTFLLSPYPYIENFRKRYYNSTLDNFRFDVFGEQIKLPSLAFQQQDKAVGACATFAIWCCFHKLRQLYKINLPSPYEITKKAGISQIHSESLFPTAGLDGYQVVSVFEESKLRTESFSFEKKSLTQNLLRELIYAYNKCGIPILLGYEFDDKSKKYDGNHIVTIVGYRLNHLIGGKASKQPKKKLTNIFKRIGKKQNRTIGLFAHDIMRFYTHNDELGPYSKVDFEDEFNNDSCRIRTFQLDGEDFAIAKPTALWIPVENTIKVKYENVLNAVQNFGAFILESIESIEDIESLKWDIHLSLAVDYKQEFSDIEFEVQYLIDLKRKIRYTSYPKYIWVVSLIEQDEDSNEFNHIDVIYDASSLPNENCIFQINCFNKELSERIIKHTDLYDKANDHPKIKNYPKYL